MKNIKNLFLCLSFLILAFSCNNGNNSKPTHELKLVSMKINDDDVKITIENKKQVCRFILDKDKEEIIAKNIEAHFSYGDVTDDILTVSIENAPFKLQQGENKNLKLKVAAVSGEHGEWQGEIRVTREQEVFDHLSAIEVHGARNNGVLSGESFENDSLKQILRGEVKTIEVLGDRPTVWFMSSKQKRLSSVKVNGSELEINDGSTYGVKNIATTTRNLSNKETDSIGFVIVAEGKTSKGKLIIKKKAGLTDITDLDLFIKTDVTNYELIRSKGSDMFQELTKNLEIDNINTTNNKVTVVIVSTAGNIKEVKEGSNTHQTTEKTIGGTTYKTVAECEVTLEEKTKQFTFTIIPKDTSKYQNTTWKITLTKK